MIRSIRLPFALQPASYKSVAPKTTIASRQFRTVLPRQDDKKSTLMDREKMNTESNEYSKTGSDAKAAQEGEAAFDPSTTSPEAEKDSSSSTAPDSESQGDPLEMSPGNAKASQPRDEQEGGAQKGASKSGPSSRGGARKDRKTQ
ncbi:hypothetical protein UCRPC4_g06867 [Phaeomoniella chlamydospora]|uniref:Uncharacterized protein n=1 Tax=Phaeomoniella chlamydospora TaxID=158046 RepID=A0A0G2GA62_PHACM|nr:hypothetical protein UCRPC4_g06867 [Phaeomoniella chlamydospora]